MKKVKIVRAAPDDEFYAGLAIGRNHPAYYEDEIFMGKPTAYWIELDSHARELGIEDLMMELALIKKICAECQMSILLGNKTCADLTKPEEKKG